MRDRLRVTELCAACGPDVSEAEIDALIEERLEEWDHGEEYIVERAVGGAGGVEEVWLEPAVWWGIVADVRGVDVGGDGRLTEVEIEELLGMMNFQG
jgi:hypothetical protein